MSIEDLCELCEMMPADCTCDWMRGPDGTGVHYMTLTKQHLNELRGWVGKMQWNQSELVRRTGIDRAVMSRFYNGRRVSVKTGFRIAMALAAGVLE